INCLTPNIEAYIKLVDNKEISKKTKAENTLKTLNDYGDKIDYDFFKKFKIPVNSPVNVDTFCEELGINSYPVNRDKPFIRKTPQINFNELFPKNEHFTIYTFDGLEIKAKLAGDFNSELHFIDFNIYLYFNRHLNSQEIKPISFKQLNDEGIAHLHFARLNETEYFFTIYDNL